ncbi:MAG: hypothetical protein ABJ308_17060 [Halieaceae bacterium]
MRKILWLLLLLPLMAMAEADDGDSKQLSGDKVVALAAVPERVAVTAKRARPGAYFVRITQKLKSDDETYYVFDASQVGKYWVIKVRADGKLMEVYESPSAPTLSKD